MTRVAPTGRRSDADGSADRDLDLGLTALRSAYADGRLRPTELMAHVVAACADSDPAIWIDLVPADEIAARAAGLEADPDAHDLPLYGIPVAVKDNIDLAGRATTAACPSFARIADTSATAVRLLEQAGAVIVGKTNLDQFATGLVGTRSPHGAPVNPRAPSHVPGGSSSGSAVAVARGLVTLALGTDTAGSGRVPAALTGIVGIKPTRGRVSTAGVVPACASLDTVSVFARSVTDGIAALDVIDRPDPADPWSTPEADRQDIALPPHHHLGVPDRATLDLLDPEARLAFAGHLDRVSDLGHEPIEIDLQPFLDVASLLYDGPWVAERLVHLEDVLTGHPDIDPTVRTILEGARDLRAVEVFRGLERLQVLRRDVDRILHRTPVLMLPSVPTFPTLAEVAADPFGPNARLGTFTNFVNLLSLAAVAVPMGVRPDGLPVGVTFLGPAGSDHAVAATADRAAGYHP